MENTQVLKFALKAISEIANSATNDGVEQHSKAICTPKSLPSRLLEKAAEKAIEINAENSQGSMRQWALQKKPTDRLAIAILTDKYWGSSTRTLSVSFMNSTSNQLGRRILGHMNSWKCGIQFERTNGTGDVRISFGPGGYWSYLGTDIRFIPGHRPTMNLQGFSMSTPDSEFYRVVRHETGHTLGMPHEHARRDIVARIHRERAYNYFWRTQRWDRATVDNQVLTPLDEVNLFKTPADQTSIMCYQLPGEITIDGTPILGGSDINDTDRAFAQEKYPLGNDSVDTHDCDQDDWDDEF